MNQLVADTGAITGLQGIVDGVSGDINSFKSSFAGPSDLSSSHGAIGFPMQNAFTGASSAREGALGATQVAAGRMAELLGKASQAYARGDTAGGEQLKAQADALGGTSSSASSAGGAGGAGQMMGQLGQMAGQMAQSITQPLQGLTQAMTQVPQQVMQGVQGIVEAATQAAGGGADAAAMMADTGGAGAEEAILAADVEGGEDGPDGDKDGDGDKDDAEAEAGIQSASAGTTPESGHGAGQVPTQIHNVNPRRL